MMMLNSRSSLLLLCVLCLSYYPSNNNNSSVFVLAQEEEADAESNNNNSTTTDDTTTTDNAIDQNSNNSNNNNKNFKICSIVDGVAVARDSSRNIQTLFQYAIEDVEYMREYWTETMKYSTPAVGELNSMTLDDLILTLDYQARGLPQGTTTIDAGLGYVDDSINRRVERIASLTNDMPYVGNKLSDFAMVNILSNILPWIVDRRSKEVYWWKNDHINGRSEGIHKPTLYFDRLYIAAYGVTWGSSSTYYPPMTSFVPTGGFNLNDVLGNNFTFQQDDALKPTLPQNNPNRVATIGTPYPDRAQPGLSIVTALAPVYYTGSWYGFENAYNDTYLGLTGIDISISSMSSLLHRLDNTVTHGSFGFLVDDEFNIYVITQDAVNYIYPEYTGMEETRVVRDELGQGDIVDDRRNQTYLVSDTILQSPTNLTNANWTKLHQEIYTKEPGRRGTSEIDIVLRGDTIPTSFYVMYDKWSIIGNFTLLLFAPKSQVDNSINVTFESSGDQDVHLTAIVNDNKKDDDGNTMSTITTGEVVFVNNGILDVTVTISGVPNWITLNDETHGIGTSMIKLAGSGRSRSSNDRDVDDDHHHPERRLVIPFTANTKGLPLGLTSSLLTVLVHDDDYPDCIYSHVYSTTISITVMETENLQQLHQFRIFGFILSSIVMITSIICVVWVILNAENPIVKAAQPIFLHILSFGTFVMGISILPLSVDDSLASDAACDVACMMLPWLFFLGFSISFSAVFSKVWRIHRLMSSATMFQRKLIRAKDVMVPFCVICTLNVGLLLALTFTDPLLWTRVPTSTRSSYGTCWWNMSDTQIALLALLTVVNFSALILVNFQAYRSRNIADELSESKYIFLAMFGMLQVIMIGVPVMFLTVESPRALFFVQSVIVFAIAWPIQLFIFLPKLMFLVKNGDDAMNRISAAARNSATRGATNSSRRPTRGSSSQVPEHLNSGASVDLSLQSGSTTQPHHNGRKPQHKTVPKSTNTKTSHVSGTSNLSGSHVSDDIENNSSPRLAGGGDISVPSSSSMPGIPPTTSVSDSGTPMDDSLIMPSSSLLDVKSTTEVIDA